MFIEILFENCFQTILDIGILSIQNSMNQLAITLRNKSGRMKSGCSV